MESLTIGTAITRASPFAGSQRQATRTSLACDLNSSRWRGPSSAPAGSLTAESFEKLALNSSSCHQCGSSQSEFLPSLRRRRSRQLLTTTTSASPSSSPHRTVSLQTGIRNRSCLSKAGRVPRCDINTGKISQTPKNLREIQQHGEGWSKKRISVWECRAAASDMGMRDTTLDLSEVPLLELLLSERTKVLLLTAFGMALCNAARVVMTVAILPMAASYGWSTSFGGIVQSSFLWGYLLSPIPGGMLADRYGGKVVMACGAAAWSLATLATPWAARHSMAALLTVRVLMGVAEGVAMPCMNNILCKWFPRWERSRAVGLTMAGFHLGSVAALLLSPGLLKNHGLSGPFWVCGALGFLWLAIWCPFISKDPESSLNVSSSEFSYISRGQDHFQACPQESVGPKLPPIREIFSKLPTWALICANSMNNWGYFILLSWMPVYFSTVLGVNLRQAAWFSAAPWAVMAAVGLVAGYCSDCVGKFGMSVTTVRKIMQSVGFLGPAAALLQLNAVTDPTIASLWLTAALGLSAFSQAGFLVNPQEIAPRYAGFLHGTSNCCGTFAAIVGTVGAGFFIEKLGSFQSIMTLTSILYVVSTLFWIMYASAERIIN
ncbi:unnamed protein product [Calypogeia fissa]